MKSPVILISIGISMMLIAAVLNIADNDPNSWKNKCIAAGGTPIIEKTFVHCLKPNSLIEIK